MNNATKTETRELHVQTIGRGFEPLLPAQLAIRQRLDEEDRQYALARNPKTAKPRGAEPRTVSNVHWIGRPRSAA